MPKQAHSYNMDAHGRYLKYKIPPDFSLAKLHAHSCKLYNYDPDQPERRCGCCNRKIGIDKVSICEYVSSLRRIGEEVPLFFNFTTLTFFLIIGMVFFKAGEWIFVCDNSTFVCDVVYCNINSVVTLAIPLGFRYEDQDTNDMETMILMVELITYAMLILGIKVHLKRKKYTYRALNASIEKRSIQLYNLPKDASEKEIKNLFPNCTISGVTFPYRVRKHLKLMKTIASLKKQLKNLHLESKNKVYQEQEQIKRIQVQIGRTWVKIQQNVRVVQKKQRLSIAFVVFDSADQRNQMLEKHEYNFLSKAFLKLCTCLSSSSIRGHHISMEQAPAPDDVQWQNLQNPYLRTKTIRVVSFLICSAILIFGVVSEVVIFNQSNWGGQGQFFSSIVIFAINFAIINFLQHTTNNLQSRESGTAIKLSLIRKITFFMFINVSISPFLIMLYNRVVDGVSYLNLLDTVSLTILCVSIGNCFKPIWTIVSIPRLKSYIARKQQANKGPKSKLTQLQANTLFQPPQFPIQLYYSLMHASLMMCFFYLGCFQMMIAIELPSLLILYFSAKWMLVKVCKQPRGLSLKLNNQAQSLMRFYIPLYWLGRNSMYILLDKDNLLFNQILKMMIYRNIYQIISTCIVVLMILCEPVVAKLGKLLTKEMVNEESTQNLCDFNNNRAYQQANLFSQIHQQDLTDLKMMLRLSCDEESRIQEFY